MMTARENQTWMAMHGHGLLKERVEKTKTGGSAGGQYVILSRFTKAHIHPPTAEWVGGDSKKGRTESRDKPAANNA